MHAQRFFGRKSQRTGLELLRDPLLNKGSSFTANERKELKLTGLLPVLEDAAADSESSYQEQLALARLGKASNDLDKFDYLMRLYDTDKFHFFRLIGRNASELLPLVYTPTVGLACENYALVHGNGRGVFIPITEAGNITSILENWPTKDVRAIVVTDGEEVLGLGDLGAYGMGIVVSKLALCTALAGIPPETCLPVVLDVGTNNTKLLEDPLYFGLREKRAASDVNDQFVNEFMQSCTKVFGKDVFIQFEGFSHENALSFQHRYNPLYSTFNDDIRSTASILLSGLFTAGRKTGRQLKEEIFVCFGVDDAMLGFIRLLVETLKSRCSLIEREARSRIFMVDSQGLIVKNRSKGEITADKAAFARPVGTPEMADLKEVIKYSKCTTLIAAAAAAAVSNALSSEMLSQLAEQCKEPLLIVLSNPTDKAESIAEAASKATKGQCLFVSGGPLPVHETSNTSTTTQQHNLSQANNSYIFPGLVLAISALRIQPINDGDFITAAEAVSELLTEEDVKEGCLYPQWDRIRCVSYKLACKVGHSAFKQSRCHRRGLKEEDIDRVVKELACYPNALPDPEA